MCGCAPAAVRYQAEPDKKPARISLYGALLLALEEPADDPFTEKVKDFYAHLTALRQMARSAPAEQLLEEIFASTGYLAALGVLENGARRREDARRFASFCATSGAGGISALVRAIDAAAQAGSTGQDTVPSGVHPGCVSIMTIHRSKGLQFPVVFVGDTARKFNASDIRQPVLVHRTFGAGLRLRPENGEGAYKTAAYTALADVHARELRSEQMRLLYVALTRAQDKLILTVPLSSGKSCQALCQGGGFSGCRGGGHAAPAGQQLCRLAAGGAAGAPGRRGAAAAFRQPGTAVCADRKYDGISKCATMPCNWPRNRMQIRRMKCRRPTWHWWRSCGRALRGSTRRQRLRRCQPRSA